MNLRQYQHLYRLNWFSLIPDHQRSRLMNSKSSMDSIRCLYRIQEKLRSGCSLLSTEDVELVRQIVESFDIVWKLANQYPELNSKLDNASFQRIFENMSSKFTSSDTTLNLICEYCDEEFTLLNNDVQLSLQMHQQTPEHEAVMRNFEGLRGNCAQQVHQNLPPLSNTKAEFSNSILGMRDPSNSTGERNVERIVQLQQQMPKLEAAMKKLEVRNYSSTSDVTPVNARGDCAQQVRQNLSTLSGGAISNQQNNSVDRWIRGTGSKRHCVLCVVHLPNDANLKSHINGLGHREDDEWVSESGSKYICDLCNVSSTSIDSLKDHLDGRKHSSEISVILKYFTFISSKKINDATISSLINLIYTSSSNSKIRLTYFLNKICIFGSKNSNHYVCGLCNNMLAEKQIHEHLLTKKHETKLKEVIENCDLNHASFEVGFIWGRASHECLNCGNKFHEKNPRNYEAHLGSKNHRKSVKFHFQSPRFKNWEKGIILRNGLPYCVFCELILKDELSMRVHINGAVHKRKIC